MTKLNIKESDLVTDVREINDEVVLNTKIKSESNFVFFGNLEVPMKEIDAAIKKLEELSRHRHVFLDNEI
ncbi:hypothetical protein IJ732_06445 [bacterium]|nr:hypothetical protein [bacterium]